MGDSLQLTSGQELVSWTVVETGGSLTVSGGTIIGNVDVWNGAEVSISGGSVADGYDPYGRPNFLGAHGDSKVNVFGTQFVLDGTDITSAFNPNVPFTVNDRDVLLTGLLTDGSSFSFDLFYFSPGATLTLTLVPEPSSLVLLIGLTAATMARKRRLDASANLPLLFRSDRPQRERAPWPLK